MSSTNIALAVLTGIVVVVAWFWLDRSNAPGRNLHITLKRYGRTMEGESVAWLRISNASQRVIHILSDGSPVPTAVCEYSLEGRTWSDRVRGFPIQSVLFPADSASFRVILPTNEVPVRVSLLANAQSDSRLSRFLRPVTERLEDYGIISPFERIPIPFELVATNVTTTFVH